MRFNSSAATKYPRISSASLKCNKKRLVYRSDTAESPSCISEILGCADCEVSKDSNESFGFLLIPKFEYRLLNVPNHMKYTSQGSNFGWQVFDFPEFIPIMELVIPAIRPPNFFEHLGRSLSSQCIHFREPTPNKP